MIATNDDWMVKFIAVFLIIIVLIFAFIIWNDLYLMPKINCEQHGKDVAYILLDNQKSYSENGQCYYPVPVRLGNGNTIRVPVETKRFLNSVYNR